jgi:transcriptional regulator with XRE-family HTH domain
VTYIARLRGLRGRVQLTQQELADVAGLSLGTVSDLERGVAATPQGETVRLLGDALHLIGPESERFETAARGRPAAGGVVGIHAIGAMAGVGKTAFAVHAAQRLAERFPGGQVFLELHGHTRGQRPVDPADALASPLLAELDALAGRPRTE